MHVILSLARPQRRASAGVAVAGILAVLHCCLDLKATIGGRHPAALFYLAAAMRPRMLMTVDEAGALLPVPVRVGQAVDVVAQARPHPTSPCCSPCHHPQQHAFVSRCCPLVGLLLRWTFEL